MSKPPRRPKDRKRCIFCGSTDLSRTHIWPNWVNQLFSGTHRQHEGVGLSSMDLAKAEVVSEIVVKQGKLTSQKPYLACSSCNSGWMAYFENEMSLVLKPAIAGTAVVILNQRQAEILAGWVALIFTLAEFTTSEGPTLPVKERMYFKRYMKPSSNWSIYVAGIEGISWAVRHHHHSLYEGRLPNKFEILNLYGTQLPKPNSHISSMGMGRLFFHAYFTPLNENLRGFDIACKSHGMVRIWPPRKRFWPLPKRKLRLPPKTVFDDTRATEVSESFYKQSIYRGSLQESLKRNRNIG